MSAKVRLRSEALLLVMYSSVSGCSQKSNGSQVIQWVNRRPVAEVTVPDVAAIDAWVAEGSRIRDAESVLISLLTRRDGRVNLVSVAAALDRLATTRSIPALIDGLKINDEWVQIYCAWALGRLHAAEALPALCDLLEHGEVGVRANVAEPIAEIGGGGARECLKKALSYEEFVAKCIRHALSKVRETPGAYAPEGGSWPKRPQPDRDRV